MRKDMDWYLVVDIGTGGVHTAIVDIRLELSCPEYERIEYLPAGVPNGINIDVDRLYASVLSLCSKTIGRYPGKQGACLGVVVTGQRHGCVFLDGSMTPTLACPNIEGRASEEVVAAAKKNGEKIYELSSRWPATCFPAMRFLWMKNNDPHRYKHVRHLLMLNEWLGWKFTGEMVSEPTNAAETLLFDLHKFDWSNELGELFLPRNFVQNPLVPTGSSIGLMHESIVNMIGLGKSVPVILAPSDTQSAAIGCGALEAGDIVVVNGSTTPIVQVVETFLEDTNRSVWLTPYVDGAWLIEANSTKSGIVYRHLVDKCREFIGSIMEGAGISVDPVKLASAIQSHPGSKSGSIAYWSPRISKLTVGSINGSALLLPPGENPYAAILPSFIDNLAFAVHGNILLAATLSRLNARNIWLTGGGNVNPRFCADIASLQDSSRVMKTRTTETTARGAVASVIGKNAAGIASITKSLRDDVDIVAPGRDNDDLQKRFLYWQRNYENIREFHERRTE